MRRESERFYEILGDMQIVDPRGNMLPDARAVLERS